MVMGRVTWRVSEGVKVAARLLILLQGVQGSVEQAGLLFSLGRGFLLRE
jgi:hypothetical protein